MSNRPSGKSHRPASGSSSPSHLEFKVVVLGDKGVGKTSLTLRFVEGTFTSNYQPTLGAFFLTKKLTSLTGTPFKMQLWDTAGQERFRAMAPMYYRNSNAAVICFDVTNEESFTQMKDWVAELTQQFRPEDLVLAVAGTKLDMQSGRMVAIERAQEYAVSVGASYFETSAKDDTGINEMFAHISEEVSCLYRCVASCNWLFIYFYLCLLIIIFNYFTYSLLSL
jgi:small GTP-binding protein